GEAFLLDYLDAMKVRPDHWFKVWHERYGINLALTQEKSKFTDYLLTSPDWILIKKVPAGHLFRRKSTPRE
ncbi:MAG TPA: hypothetical protein PKA06_10715, partial [Gemmatales bacterium]|nr:hypothetical protein [Gemmatales bacterium]